MKVFKQKAFKKAFTIIEVAITLVIIFGVASFVVPIAMDNTRQAKFISEWVDEYTKIKYVFSVLSAQLNQNLVSDYGEIKDSSLKEAIMWEVIKPHLRVKTTVNNNIYKPQYRNKINLTDDNQYEFEDKYITEQGKIVGIKWLSGDCEVTACARMMFDVNGMSEPNTWGVDIFGIDIFKDRIEPFGFVQEQSIQNSECKTLRGLYCSSYYLIGGSFD